MTRRSKYVLIRNPGAAVHVVSAHSWLTLTYPPRTRCQQRVGPKWMTVAATSRPSQIAKTDSCRACVQTFGCLYPHYAEERSLSESRRNQG